MSTPGSLWNIVDVNGFAVYIWNSVDPISNNFMITFRHNDKVLFSTFADYEKVLKIEKGEFEIESQYCPFRELDEFYLIVY